MMALLPTTFAELSEVILAGFALRSTLAQVRAWPHPVQPARAGRSGGGRRAGRLAKRAGKGLFFVGLTVAFRESIVCRTCESTPPRARAGRTARGEHGA